MGKWSKRISFILVIILLSVFLKNLFSKPEGNNELSVDYSNIYDLKTDPVTIKPPEDSYISKTPKDDSLKYTKFWDLPKIYNKSSKDCLDNYLNFHPTVVVKRDKLFEYYGIKIGTAAWYDLVASYEKQAINICYSYSGLEVEELYASLIRKSFTPSELKEILDFHKTDLGQKLIRVSNEISRTIQAEVAKKQTDAVNIEVPIFNEETERLYLKYLDEDGGWFERNWYKAFSD